MTIKCYVTFPPREIKAWTEQRTVNNPTVVINTLTRASERKPTLNLFYIFCSFPRNRLWDFIFCYRPFVNPQAQDLISRMLSKEAKERINIAEIKVIFRDLFKHINIVYNVFNILKVGKYSQLCNLFWLQEHAWVTEGGRFKLPSTEEHCSVIEVTEEEVRNSIKIISKLSSLVSCLL